MFSIFNNFSFAGNIAALSGVNTCSCTMRDCLFDVRSRLLMFVGGWIGGEVFGTSHTKKIFLLR